MVAKRIKRQQRPGDVLESAPVRAAQFRHVPVETKVCHARIARWFCPLSNSALLMGWGWEELTIKFI